MPAQYQKLAFSDLEVPLEHGQVMMAPKIEARMLQALQIKEEDNILEIGTGSGFVTACMAKLGQHVESVEYYESLSNQAQILLQQQQLKNYSLQVADVLSDSFLASLKNKKYDVIAITASMPIYNEVFEKYLSDNGRLFVIAGQAPVMQAKLIACMQQYGCTYTNLFETNLAPLIGMQTPRKFEL